MKTGKLIFHFTLKTPFSSHFLKAQDYTTLKTDHLLISSLWIEYTMAYWKVESEDPASKSQLYCLLVLSPWTG